MNIFEEEVNEPLLPDEIVVKPVEVSSEEENLLPSEDESEEEGAEDEDILDADGNKEVRASRMKMGMSHLIICRSASPPYGRDW